MGNIGEALKAALIAALVTFGLAFPIVALRTDTNLSNQLVLNQRWGLALALAGAAFAVRFVFALLYPAGFVRRAAKPRSEVPPHPYLRFLPRVGLALLLAFPFIALAVASAGGPGILKVVDTYGIQILIYVLLGLGLNIILGLAGLLDLGFVAFYAVGAYCTALLTTTYGFSFWIALPIAGIVAALWGVLISLPVLRLKGDYIAIVTLAFAEIVRLVLVNWVPVTGGYAGLSDIPKPTLFGYSLGPGPDSLWSALSIPYAPIYRLAFMYYLVLALALAAYFVTLRLRTLPVGRAWEALREDEIACRSLGINTVTTKLTAFAAGAFFGGLAGAFFAAHYSFVSPKSFEFLESAMIVAIVVLGGLGSMLGVAIAATAMVGGTELLRELGGLQAVFGSGFDPAQYRMLLFGLAMVVLMVLRPKGLVSTREPSVRLAARPTRGSPAHRPQPAE